MAALTFSHDGILELACRVSSCLPGREYDCGHAPGRALKSELLQICILLAACMSIAAFSGCIL